MVKRIIKRKPKKPTKPKKMEPKNWKSPNKKINSEVMAIVKQLIKLEDKLFNYEKRCNKCIKETLLLIEAMVDKLLQSHHANEKKLYPLLYNLPNELRKFQKKIFKCKKDSQFNRLTQGIRKIRKELIQAYYDHDRNISEAEMRKIVNSKCPRDILPVLNPCFNVREVVKNILLLRNHLLIKENRCFQCIRKHSLIIEAFIDEAYSLDKKGKCTKMLKPMGKRIRAIQKRLIKEDRNAYYDMAKELEKMENIMFDTAFNFIKEVKC